MKNSTRPSSKTFLNPAPLLKISLVLLLLCLIQAPARTSAAQSNQSPPLQTAENHPLPPELPRFNHLDTQAGLAHNHVTAIIQDRFGFMWFGTESGLNRFDGYRFSRFHNLPDNPTSLSSNNISAVVEGPNGYIWAATEDGGLNRVDPATNPESGLVVRYVNEPGSPNSLSHDHIESLAFDQDGILWIGTGSGTLNRFDPATETFTRYQPSTIEAAPVAIEALFVRPDGTLWIGGEALYLFDPVAETFTSFPIVLGRNVTSGQISNAPPGQPPPEGPPPDGQPPPPGAGPPLSNHVNAVYEDADGRVWIGSDNLYRLEPENRWLTRYFLPDDERTPILEIIEDINGSLWLAAQSGIKLFNPETEQFERNYQAERNDPNSLSGSHITAFYQSPELLVWIGTTAGLNIFSWRQQPFTAYLPGGPPTGFENANIHTITIDPNGDLWIAGGPTLNRIDQETGLVTPYELGLERSPNADQIIIGISDISVDSRGFLWLDELMGLIRLDPETEETERFPLPGDTDQNLLDLATGPAGNIWVLTAESLLRFDLESEQYTDEYPHHPADNAALDDLAAETLQIDSSGIIWISGASFLTAFNPQTEQFQHYFHDPQDPASMSRGKVTAVYRDPSGQLWFASESGLLTLDEESGQFGRFTESDGLPSDGVLGILPDDQGFLWLSTFLGLSRFDVESGTFRNFNQDEGLPFDEFITGSAFKAADGELYFGGRGGVVSFYPQAITKNLYQPPVVITEMRLGNDPVFVGQENDILSAPIWDTNEITLSHDQDIIAFEFAALSYTSPRQNTYQYNLVGLEEGWSTFAPDTRSARYTTLPPGQYTFKVRGTNNDGLQSEQEAAINITVLPPWWQTLWFQGLVLILILGLLVSGYRWRVYSIQRRNQQLERDVAARTQELAESNQQLLVAKEAAEVASNAKSTFLSNMSHELRTPLNGVLGYAQILRRDRNLTPPQVDGLQVIYESGHHLLTLINDVLDLAKVEAGKLELLPKAFRLGPFLDGLVALIRMSAQQKDIRLIYEPDPDLPAEVEADEKRLRQVLLNLLGNAVKFTDDGAITLRVINLPNGNATEAALRFEVEDSGVGMTAEQLQKIFQPFEQVGDMTKQTAGTGLGLPISQQLVELMGGHIQVESQPGVGSLFWFEITLPVSVSKVGPERPSGGTISGYEGPRRHILVADDRRENRMVLQSMLVPLGFELSLAANGQEALDMTRMEQPDLVLIDLVMPELTGFEAVQAIRQIPALAETPIIAISASVFAMDQAKSRLAGCDAFLPKPIEADRLLAHIEALLALTWTYSAPAAPTAKAKTAELAAAPLILPPLDQMEMLYELAMLGKITQIRDQINQLQQKDSQYAPFGQKILALADAFEDKAIADFLREAMGIDSETKEKGYADTQ